MDASVNVIVSVRINVSVGIFLSSSAIRSHFISSYLCTVWRVEGRHACMQSAADEGMKMKMKMKMETVPVMTSACLH